MYLRRLKKYRDITNPVILEGEPVLSNRIEIYIEIMNVPENLKYTEDHEWILFDASTLIARVGITDFAQSELGDIVYVEIETLGEKLEAHEVFGSVEAVKTVSDLFIPVAGEVLKLNGSIASEPELVNKDPYGEGWMIEIKLDNPDNINNLLTPEKYAALIS